MTRPSQLLHPPRPPVPALPAATVLLLRDGAQGLEARVELPEVLPA